MQFWNATEIRTYIANAAGKMQPLEIAAAVVPNINRAELAVASGTGAPTSGTFEIGHVLFRSDGRIWLNVEAGTPGVWVADNGEVYPTTTFVGKPAAPVADVAALKAVAVADREDKQTRFVESVRKEFAFDSASALTGDDIYVIAPTAGTGRWIWIEEAVRPTGIAYLATNGKTAAQGADGSAEKPYSTLADCYTTLAAGGTILVAPGTYTSVTPLSAIPTGVTIKAVGGTVTITAAAGKIGVIGASKSVRLDGFVVVQGIADSNAIELADGGGGAATTLALYNGATVNSAGTGHGVAVLGKGAALNSSGAINAAGTGNGVDLANNLGAGYVGNELVGSVGGVPINKTANATCTFTRGFVPFGCTFTAGAGSVNVISVPAVRVFTFGALPTATGVAPGTIVRCSDFPSADGANLVSDGAKWVVKDFAPKTILALGDADAPITAAQMLANGVYDATAMLAGRTYTTATAAELVTAFAGCGVGTAFEFMVSNPTAFTATVAAGVGVTLDGSGIILAGTRARFRAQFTNVTAAAEAVTLIRLQTESDASYTFATLPAAATLPAGTHVRCSDRPVAKFQAAPGAMVYTDGTVWRYVADGKLVTAAERKTFIDDDFNTLVPIALYTDIEIIATGTAANQAGANGDGELRLNIPAALDAVTHHFTQLNTSPARNPEIEFQGVTLSRITDIVAEVGLRTVAGTDIVRFIFDTAVDGFWHYESTAVAGGTTNAATAVSPVATTPQNLRFVLTSATSVAFYIADILVGTAAVAANIPAVLMTPYSRAIGLAAAVNGTVDVGRVRLDLDA